MSRSGLTTSIAKFGSTMSRDGFQVADADDVEATLPAEEHAESKPKCFPCFKKKTTESTDSAPTASVVEDTESAPRRWFGRKPVSMDRPQARDRNIKKSIKDAVLFKWFERVPAEKEQDQETPAPAHSVINDTTSKFKKVIHYSWLDSVFNSRAGPSMQRLLLKKSTKKDLEGHEEDDEGMEAEIESSHEFVVRPGVPRFLKYVLAPLIMSLQFIVFLEIYQDKKGSCTDYKKWSPQTKFGIGLASLFVCAQICAQAFQGIRILLAGYYSRQPYAVMLAMGMLTQFCFEILVYSVVMGTSTSLEDLIKDFVALAVANETDDKVGSYLNIKTAKKIMFLDPIEDDEMTQLQQEAQQLKAHEHGYKVLRSRTFGANHWNFIMNAGYAWGVRLALLTVICVAVFSQVLVTWDTPCVHNSQKYKATYNNYIIPTGATTASVLTSLAGDYTALATAGFDITSSFDGRDSSKTVSFSSFAPFNFPYASDFTNNPVTYNSVTITSNGLFQFTDSIRGSYNFPDLPLVQAAQIAPFFGNYLVELAQGSHFYAFGVGLDGTKLKIDSTTTVVQAAEVVFILEKGTFSAANCVAAWQGDSFCDTQNNNADCLYDGGDCCISTCKPPTVTASSSAS